MGKNLRLLITSLIIAVTVCLSVTITTLLNLPPFEAIILGLIIGYMGGSLAGAFYTSFE